MLKKTAFLFTTLLVISSSLQAQTVIAKYAGEFMALGVGGRALGMGELLLPLLMMLHQVITIPQDSQILIIHSLL